jgi:hypothetical protein
VEVGATAAAKISPWPAKVWADAPGITFEAGAANGTFKAAIAKDAPVGPHLIRVYNADGTSSPHVFVVGRHAEVLEREPNDDARKAQPIDALPAIVNGRLEKPGDVDSFSVQVEAGRWIVGELQCRRLGAPIDPALHLLDPDGNEVAFNHDTFGLDPLIACRAVRPGRYVVQVVGFDYPPSTNVRFAGSKAAVYRLLLTTGPYARYAFPAGLKRGQKAALQIGGWNLGESGTRTSVEFDAIGLPAHLPFKLLTVPDIDNSLPIALGDCPERSFDADEYEPGKPRDVKPPVTLNGRLAHAGETHRYRFMALKGRQYHFAPAPFLSDLPVRPALVLEDAHGAAIARGEGAEAGDAAAIEWTAPADGTYTLAVSDLYHEGGDESVYRIEMRPVTPDYRATRAADALKLEAGKSAPLKVTIAREGGFAAPVEAVLTGLPAGVTATTSGATIAGELTLTLAAAPGAAPANVPLRVLAVAADPDDPRPRVATFALAPDSLVPACDTIWLTVVPRPPATQP